MFILASIYQNKPGVATNQPVPRLMTVIDLKGISFFSFTTDVLNFLRKSSEMIDNYYPEQVARLVIVNAPSFFSSFPSTTNLLYTPLSSSQLLLFWYCRSLSQHHGASTIQ